jgi:hypothetical protein
MNYAKARLAVFFLNLTTLGAMLFSLVFSIYPLVIKYPPVPIASGGVIELPPGCSMVVVLIFMVPISFIPALVSWMIRERIIRPREAAEQKWRESAPWREERLWAWTMYAADLFLRHQALRGTPVDPVLPLLRAELPRAFSELDRGRRERLRLFLQEVGLKDLVEGSHVAEGMPDSESIAELPRRSLVLSVVVVLFLTSIFLVLWIGLSATTLLTTNVKSILGSALSKAEISVGLSGCLIPALILMLAAMGLLRLYGQAMRAWHQREESSLIVQDLALKTALDHIDILAGWAREGGGGVQALSLQLARAVVLLAVSELDGSRRGKLVQALFESGWLTGENKLILEGADLRGAELATTTMPKVCLAGSDLSGSDLSAADLGNADLRRCTLRGSDLRSCRLGGADLRRADLRHARLQKAILSGADLREVLLDGANFWGAELANVELTGAQGSAEHLVPTANPI